MSHPSPHQSERRAGFADQKRIRLAARISQSATSAAHTGDASSSNASPRGHFRPKHRCPSLAFATQARDRPECATCNRDGARRWLYLYGHSQAVLNSGTRLPGISSIKSSKMRATEISLQAVGKFCAEPSSHELDSFVSKIYQAATR